MTPTIGIQMPIILLLWYLVRRFRQAWEFNLLVALAWTWVSNVVTLPPLYYLYLVTGRVLSGDWDKIADYQTFSQRLGELLSVGAGWLETLWIYTYSLFVYFGAPMFLGSIPWAIVSAWLGYRWTYRVLLRRRERRASRRTVAAVQAPVPQEDQ